LRGGERRPSFFISIKTVGSKKLPPCAAHLLAGDDLGALF
jgi:hypothetical protein